MMPKTVQMEGIYLLIQTIFSRINTLYILPYFAFYLILPLMI
jgi:hypothetical protein